MSLVNVDMEAKSPYFKTKLLEPAVTTSKEPAPSTIEHMKDEHAVTKANKDAACTVADSDSDPTD